MYQDIFNRALKIQRRYLHANRASKKAQSAHELMALKAEIAQTVETMTFVTDKMTEITPQFLGRGTWSFKLLRHGKKARFSYGKKDGFHINFDYTENCLAEAMGFVFGNLLRAHIPDEVQTQAQIDTGSLQAPLTYAFYNPQSRHLSTLVQGSSINAGFARRRLSTDEPIKESGWRTKDPKQTFAQTLERNSQTIQSDKEHATLVLDLLGRIFSHPFWDESTQDLREKNSDLLTTAPLKHPLLAPFTDRKFQRDPLGDLKRLEEALIAIKKVLDRSGPSAQETRTWCVVDEVNATRVQAQDGQASLLTAALFKIDAGQANLDIHNWSAFDTRLGIHGASL